MAIAEHLKLATIALKLAKKIEDYAVGRALSDDIREAQNQRLNPEKMSVGGQIRLRGQFTGPVKRDGLKGARVLVERTLRLAEYSRRAGEKYPAETMTAHHIENVHCGLKI